MGRRIPRLVRLPSIISAGGAGTRALTRLTVGLLRVRVSATFTDAASSTQATFISSRTISAMPSTQPQLPEDGLPILPFASAVDFEKYLKENHASPGLHLKFAKKASGIASITAAEAVEVALCYGWIDGRANSLDENYWLVRYTPRRAKSIWSQKNVNTVSRLIGEGRMHEAGLKAVEAAKEDGRLDRAYAGPATIQIPDDFAQSLEQSPPAKAFFETLNKSQRYSVLWRIETASPKTKSKRIEALVQMLATGDLPGAPNKAKAETKKSSGVTKRTNTRTAKA